MSEQWVPRLIESVLVYPLPNAIVVRWILGDVIPGGADAEFSGYGVAYYGPDGYGGKRLGVRFSREVSAYAWDNTRSTQANYNADAVLAESDEVTVTFVDASFGLTEVGTIEAWSHVDGNDVQVDFPVTLVR